MRFVVGVVVVGLPQERLGVDSSLRMVVVCRKWAEGVRRSVKGDGLVPGEVVVYPVHDLDMVDRVYGGRS
jgi:hypothetical protein